MNIRIIGVMNQHISFLKLNKNFFEKELNKNLRSNITNITFKHWFYFYWCQAYDYYTYDTQIPVAKESVVNKLKE